MRENFEIERTMVHEIIGHEPSEDAFSTALQETPSLAEIIRHAFSKEK